MLEFLFLKSDRDLGEKNLFLCISIMLSSDMMKAGNEKEREREKNNNKIKVRSSEMRSCLAFKTWPWFGYLLPSA